MYKNSRNTRIWARDTPIRRNKPKVKFEVPGPITPAVKDDHRPTQFAEALTKALTKTSMELDTFKLKLQSHQSKPTPNTSVNTEQVDRKESQYVGVPIEVRLDLLRKRYKEFMEIARGSKGNVLLRVSASELRNEILRLEKLKLSRRGAAKQVKRQITGKAKKKTAR